ncbi:MAG: 5-(carboxyamino)imidazole ribonucleotide mutase [Eubacteriales bacterium]|nr:5-(carboxyamino)imidazole ribonucleotide mutase [Eubacteriales bacterium]
MKKILIIIGSDSDFPVIKDSLSILKRFGIEADTIVCSAHRTPDQAAKSAREAKDKGYGVIIAAAGLAAHLPGVIAAYTTLPVIGVPIASGPLNGTDALYSIVQMPSGVPVAAVTIDGGTNAALLAVQILAVENSELSEKLYAYKSELRSSVERKNMVLKSRIADLDK